MSRYDPDKRWLVYQLEDLASMTLIVAMGGFALYGFVRFMGF